MTPRAGRVRRGSSSHRSAANMATENPASASMAAASGMCQAEQAIDHGDVSKWIIRRQCPIGDLERLLDVDAVEQEALRQEAPDLAGGDDRDGRERDQIELAECAPGVDPRSRLGCGRSRRPAGAPEDQVILLLIRADICALSVVRPPRRKCKYA